MRASSPLLSPGRVLSALVAVTLALCVLPTTSPAAVFGLQGLTHSSGSDTANLDQAKRSGAKLFRLEATWSQLEPSAQGVRDPAALARLDGLVDAVSARGMKAVVVLVSTPCWASSAPAEERGSCSGPDANREAVTRYQPADAQAAVPIATFLAARYAPRLAAFQVWNEPDQSNEKYWAGPDKAVNYVRLVKALYRPLKQAAPTVPVLAGSFVGTDGRWLRAMYRAGIKGSYDGLAVQFYTSTLYALRTTHAVQQANGDRTPLWLTEWGFTSCYRTGGPAVQIDQTCVTRSGAARGVTDVLTALRRRPWVKAAILYDVADDGPGGYTFGLFTADGRAKPAFTAVRRVLTGRVRTPTRPTLRLRRSGGRLVVSGTASRTELLTLRVSRAGALRLRGTLLADRLNRFRVVLPAVLGTSGLRVSLSAGWTGSRTATS